jgi:hypothetical protein
MPTDDSRMPTLPVLPWRRPPVTRDRKGQWQPGVSGNPKGRPTKAKLAARLAARPSTTKGYEQMKRRAAYEGLTPDQLARVGRILFGASWKTATARELMLSTKTIQRWANGERKMSLENERLILMLFFKRACHTRALVRAMYRRAEAAHRARQELAEPRWSRYLDRPGAPRTDF